MKKRDKVKAILPYALGGLYYLVLRLVVGDTEIADWFYVVLGLLWVFLTYGSVHIIEEGIDLFDHQFDNEFEGED